LPDDAAPAVVRAAAEVALRRDLAGVMELDSERWFLHPLAPPPRLLIVGAVHIAQVLVPLAEAAGFAVSVIDPRGGFATAARFPGVRLIQAWPDEALTALAPDARTAVVTLTHDPKLDDPALDLALRGPAFFIGSLGSRKTQAARLERLAALGHAPVALARIRGPVGLAIGALTTPEIAVSILAEVIACRRGAALARR